VDLDVPTGAIYGLIGPNGSGKTTLLEIVAGLRRPSSGRLELGVPRQAISYCPDVAEFEPWLSAIEVLDAAVGLAGKNRSRSELTEILHTVGLGEATARRVGGFSLGMTTRLNVAAGLVGAPGLLLVDELAAALDPAGRAELLGVLAGLAPATTVVVSSHDLGDVEAICNHIGILDHGRLAFQGTLEGLLAGAGASRWRLVVRPPAEVTLAALAAATWVASVAETAPGEIVFSAPDPEAVEANLAGLLVRSGARVVSLAPAHPSLEEVFFSLTAGAGAGTVR